MVDSTTNHTYRTTNETDRTDEFASYSTAEFTVVYDPESPTRWIKSDTVVTLGTRQ